MLNFETFISELLAWTLEIDNEKIPSSPNLISFLQSRQKLGNSGLEVVLYKSYESLIQALQSGDQNKDRKRKEFNATLEQYGD